MGYTTDGNIKTYWPDDTENEMYISTKTDLVDIIEKINEKWPNVDLKKISFEGEYIHTHCLTYDLYDPLDYTTFIKITKSD